MDVKKQFQQKQTGELLHMRVILNLEISYTVGSAENKEHV